MQLQKSLKSSLQTRGIPCPRINQASYNDSAYYFLLLCPRHTSAKDTPAPSHPLSGFANAAQLSEIVCENTTQYSRIMMTLLTPVPGASHKKKKGKKKKVIFDGSWGTARTSSAGLNALNAPL